MRTPHKKFGGFTLKTRKERYQAAEEAKWAELAGPITISHLPTREEETEFSEKTEETSEK